MKAVKIELAGRTRYLAFTVEAMFQMQELFGGSAELIDAIRADNREGFDAACKAAAILAEQGEPAGAWLRPGTACGRRSDCRSDAARRGGRAEDGDSLCPDPWLWPGSGTGQR